jgi:xanthine dehydrogenase large subunit
MKSGDIYLHVKGESLFVDDRIIPENTLYASVFSSNIARGKISNLNTEKALGIEGVISILTAEDIPGNNQIGNIIKDEVLLAEDEVHFIGQPIALVVAEDGLTARKAVQKLSIEYNELQPVLDPREAFEKGLLIAPERTFSCGDVNKTWKRCDYIIEGSAETGAQEHLYLETQGAFAYPAENGKIKVVSATQSATVVQRTVASLLNLKMHRVEVDVLRLGGAFGGKEDQATAWACLASLAAHKLKRAVKLILRRHDDIIMTGKRHPYTSDFKIGLDKEGKILAYEVMFFQNAGAAADLSTAILERTLFHTTNSYFIPNVKATAASCKTNIPPNTAFRGFGAPQAMFVLESAIFKAAETMGVDPSAIQKKNLLNYGDEFPYGMSYESHTSKLCWEKAENLYDIGNIRNRVNTFNSKERYYKKGVTTMPVCFGISFTSTFLNQASSLVHIYTDGSVGISTAAVEMGQGVNTKIRQVAAREFSINLDRIRVESTNTTRIANTSPTAASTGADLNGHATRIACMNILERLKKIAARSLNAENGDKIEIKDEMVYNSGKKTDMCWNDLIKKVYLERVSLSSHAHYATPGIYFDKTREKGKPFAYHVCGTAVTEVTVDCLRGTYEVNFIKIVHDGGNSIDPMIDRGQIEGGVVQGIGWMTMEELIHDSEGRVVSDALSTYKIPDIHFTPEEITAHFLDIDETNLGIYNSKAIGEPPFMYGIGTYFALLKAVKAFNPDVKLRFEAPMTPEKVLIQLHENK